MTRARVAGYRALCRSIALLERRIAALEREAAPSRPGRRELDRLREERDRLAKEREAVRRFVDEIRGADELVWQIVEMYYMGREKPSLQAVAMRMGWQSEFAPRHRLKRFFERVDALDSDQRQRGIGDIDSGAVYSGCREASGPDDGET